MRRLGAVAVLLVTLLAAPEPAGAAPPGVEASFLVTLTAQVPAHGAASVNCRLDPSLDTVHAMWEQTLAESDGSTFYDVTTYSVGNRYSAGVEVTSHGVGAATPVITVTQGSWLFDYDWPASANSAELTFTLALFHVKNASCTATAGGVAVPLTVLPNWRARILNTYDFDGVGARASFAADVASEMSYSHEVEDRLTAAMTPPTVRSGSHSATAPDGTVYNQPFAVNGPAGAWTFEASHVGTYSVHPLLWILDLPA